MEASSGEKWQSSFIAGVLFFIVASPFLFDLVNGVVSRFGYLVAVGGCPTYLGLALHAVVFMLLARLMM